MVLLSAVTSAVKKAVSRLGDGGEVLQGSQLFVRHLLKKKTVTAFFYHHIQVENAMNELADTREVLQDSELFMRSLQIRKRLLYFTCLSLCSSGKRTADIIRIQAIYILLTHKKNGLL